VVDLYREYGLGEMMRSFPDNFDPGLLSPVKLYFNEKDELLYLSYQKGLYETKSRDLFSIATMEEEQGVRLVSMGVPGFGLKDEELMVDFLCEIPLKVVSEDLELEVTFGRIEAGEDRRSGSEVRQSVLGRVFNGFVGKYSEGPHSVEYLSELIDYDRDEQVRRIWKFQAFKRDFVRETGQSAYVLYSDAGFDEPLLEAYQKMGFSECEAWNRGRFLLG